MVIGNATFVQVWYTQASVLLACHSGCVSPAAVREGNGAMPKRSERCCLMDSKLKMTRYSYLQSSGKGTRPSWQPEFNPWDLWKEN